MNWHRFPPWFSNSADDSVQVKQRQMCYLNGTPGSSVMHNAPD
ncbi:hypothetical protein ACKFKG_10380 [Phormidesmis sp. 146-35]